MREGKVTVLEIRTAEGVIFPLHLASPFSRCLAWMIDSAVILLLISILSSSIGLTAMVSLDAASSLILLGQFILTTCYCMILEWIWRGQTLGKRVMGLRVMDVQALRLTWQQVVIRNLFRVIDGMPYLYFVGGVSCWMNRRAQRLGDFVANTIVVRNLKVSQPDLEQFFSGKYNSFREYPHLVARLRQQVSTESAGVALQTVLRRDALDADARVRLFQELAESYRQQVAFPPELQEGMTDEQYVRNVVDVLYRRSDHPNSGNAPSSAVTLS